MTNRLSSIPDSFRAAVMSSVGHPAAQAPVERPQLAPSLYRRLAERYPPDSVRAVPQLLNLLPPATMTLCSPFFRGPLEVAAAANGIQVVAYREDNEHDLQPLLDDAGIPHDYLRVIEGDYREAIREHRETFLYVAPPGLQEAEPVACLLRERIGWVLVSDRDVTSVYRGHYILPTSWPRMGQLVLSRDFLAV